jgi:uncharacterized coiled-coil protein SlyX
MTKLEKTISALETMVADGTKTVRELESQVARVTKQESDLQEQLLHVIDFTEEQKLKAAIFNARKAGAASRTELAKAKGDLARLQTSLEAARADLLAQQKAEAVSVYNTSLAEAVGRLYEVEDAITRLVQAQKEFHTKYPDVVVPDAGWLTQVFSFGCNENISQFKTEVQKYLPLLRASDPILKSIAREHERDAGANHWKSPGSAVFQQ